MDELVSKLADVYERKAFSELLKMILQMVQADLVRQLGRFIFLQYFMHLVSQLLYTVIL